MKLYLLSLVLILSAGCKSHTASMTKNSNGGDEVYTVKSADSAMNEAIEKAKKEFPEFLEIFNKGDTSNSGFSIKMRFNYGEDNGEHMWINQLHYRNKKLFGILASDPVSIKNLASGDTLEIKEALVSDWMYVRDHRMKGGYTIKAIYNRMSKDEKEELRKSLHFEID